MPIVTNQTPNKSQKLSMKPALSIKVFFGNSSDVAMKDLREKAHYYVVGTYLGYPPCCITQFITDHCAQTKKTYPYLKSYGFLPCFPCVNLIKKTSLQSFIDTKITPNRSHSQPFPLENDGLVAQAYLHHINKVLPQALPSFNKNLVSTFARLLTHLNILIVALPQKLLP